MWSNTQNTSAIRDGQEEVGKKEKIRRGSRNNHSLATVRLMGKSLGMPKYGQIIRRFQTVNIDSVVTSLIFLAALRPSSIWYKPYFCSILVPMKRKNNIFPFFPMHTVDGLFPFKNTRKMFLSSLCFLYFLRFRRDRQSLQYFSSEKNWK